MDTYSKLLNSASELFRKKGYTGTGINEVVEYSGAPKGCLYYYFPGGKEEVAITVVKKYNEVESKRIKKILSSSSNVIKSFESLFDNFINKLIGNNKYENLSITLLSLESINVSEKLREECAIAFDTLKKIFAEKLIENDLKEEVAEEKAMALLSIFNGALTLCLANKDITYLYVAKNQIRNILTETYKN